MDISRFSVGFNVRRLDNADIPRIYDLCKKNLTYYLCFPPMVTEQSIENDMKAVPPGKTLQEKYYLGYFDEVKLVAVLDLIRNYPDENCTYIGFFMTEVTIQRAGIGSRIIDELCGYLSGIGVVCIRLGWVKENEQAAHFWLKNGFCESGFRREVNGQTIVIAERRLGKGV